MVRNLERLFSTPTWSDTQAYVALNGKYDR